MDHYLFFFLSVYHFLYVENNCTKKEKAFVAQVGRQIRQDFQSPPGKAGKVSFCVCVYVSSFILQLAE